MHDDNDTGNKLKCCIVSNKVFLDDDSTEFRQMIMTRNKREWSIVSNKIFSMTIGQSSGS